MPTAGSKVFGWKRQLRIRTDDDVTLCVERLPPKGACRGAVILCHGLSANGFVFDVPGHSLARYLADRGYECFIPDLRGARYSGTPPKGWGLDDYIEQDLPAIFDLVRAQALSPNIHWLGHSMGGLLFFMYASEHPEVPITRAVMVGSSLDYRVGYSVFRDLRAALPIARALRELPFGKITRLGAHLVGHVPTPIEKVNFHSANVDVDVIKSILADCFGPLPTTLLSDLDSTFSEGGLSRRRGLLRYAELWARYRFPTLLLAGAADVQCPVESVDESARVLSHLRELRVLPFGKKFGHHEDYGHYDLIVGRNAPSEVWPRIIDWLQRDAHRVEPQSIETQNSAATAIVALP